MAAENQGGNAAEPARQRVSKVSQAPLKAVRIDGHAILKIVKHCKECMPSLVTGQLLGLDVGSTLEITDCFPFPSLGEGEGEAEEGGENYQLKMLRHLRAVNVDANTVGWYQSTYMGSYHTEQLIETFLSYAENIQRCVCLVYDPLRSQHGALALKALRLTDAFLELYRSGEVTTERVQEKGITWSDVLTEIPITVQNSTLASSLMRCCAPGPESVTEQDLDRLNMSTYPFLERNMEFLVDCMDDLQLEAQKQAQYQRAVQRQQQQQAQWLQRRRQENSSRQAQGLEPLPEEDPSNPIFKLPNEPSRLDELLVTNQVSNYCWQVDRFSKQSLEKLQVLEGLHGRGSSSSSELPATN